MTHFSDALRYGAAGTAADTSGRTPLETSAPSGPAYGAPVPNMGWWGPIVPATSVANALATAQTVSGTTFTLAAGTSITSTTINSGGTTYSVYKLDVPRCLAFSGAATSVTATFYTVSGFDFYQKRMTETVSGTTGTSRWLTLKAFAYIHQITAAGNTTSNVVIGTADTLGAPYYIENLGTANIVWNNTLVTTSSGLTVGSTATPTATSGDVRGTFAVSPAADGARALTGRIFIRQPNNEDTVYGKTQA